MDSLGVLEWDSTYGGSDWDFGSDARQLSDGGFIVVGTMDWDSAQVVLLRTDSIGGVCWLHTYGGASHDVGRRVAETPDGRFVVGAYTYSFGAGAMDVWLLCASSTGDSLWSRFYGGTNDDRLDGMCLTADGGYALAGYTRCTDGTTDMYVVKTGCDTTLIPPQNIIIRVVGEDVLLNWSRDSYPEYAVYSAYSVNGPFDLEGTTTDTTFILPGVAEDMWRYFHVRGIIP